MTVTLKPETMSADEIDIVETGSWANPFSPPDRELRRAQ